MTRRSVLLTGVSLAAVGAAGGCFAVLPEPAVGARILSAHEAEIIEGLARVMFPPGYFSVHGGDGKTAPMLDAILADMVEAPAARGVRYLLRAIELGTLISRGVRFTALPIDEQAEVVDIWFSENPAPRRMASDSFKALIGMAFLRRPEVVQDIGWRRGCIDVGGV
ncbi:MAG: hypothetical protein AAFV53_40610 [Myxococcota bacterium]